MELNRTITVANSDHALVCERTVAYLTSTGYVQTSRQGELFFHRGSALGSLLSSTPRRWRAEVTVRTAVVSSGATEATVKVSVNTTGQLVTEKERRYWAAELDGLEECVRTGTVDLAPLAASRSAQKQNLAVIVFILVLAFGLALGARSFFHSRAAFYVGGAVGLTVALLVAKRWLRP